MEVRAYLRNLHIAPRKVRAVAHMIRGMSVEDAQRELRHRIRRSSAPLAKLVRSARASAERTFPGAEARDMTIKEIRVDPGPVSKKFRPRAFGRAAPIRRRTSHVSLLLEARGGQIVPGSGRKEAPIVRDARREDLRDDMRPPRPRSAPDAAARAAPKQPGFIRRVFRRKVI